MTDIALALGPDGSSADIAIVNGDIALDDGLQTAVILSLICNRRADPEDRIPASANPMGWWGDAYLPALPDGSADFYGSKLWLRIRVTATQANANLIRNDIQQALNWMILDGVATDIDVQTAWNSATALSVTIAISQLAGPGSTPAVRTFNLLWDKTLGLSA